MAKTTTKQTHMSRKFFKETRTKDFDILFVLTADDNIWIIPEENVPGGFTISLREGGKYEQYRIHSA